MSLLAEMSWGQWMLAVMITLICLFLMLVILLQRGRGMGIAGAFGGGGGSSAFGAKTGDVFTWITVIVAGVFLVLIIAGNFVFDMSAEARTEPVVATDAGAPVDAMPISPGAPAPAAPGGAKPMPMKLEQVPVDPNDPSKGMTFKAVQMTPEEAAKAGAPPSEGTTQPAAVQPQNVPPATPPTNEPADTEGEEDGDEAPNNENP